MLLNNLNWTDIIKNISLKLNDSVLHFNNSKMQDICNFITEVGHHKQHDKSCIHCRSVYIFCIIVCYIISCRETITCRYSHFSKYHNFKAKTLHEQNKLICLLCSLQLKLFSSNWSDWIHCSIDNVYSLYHMKDFQNMIIIFLWKNTFKHGKLN
jgi:hypothetical protein